MGEIILKTTIKREKGYLYYVAFDSQGRLQIGKAKLKVGGTKKTLAKDLYKETTGFKPNEKEHLDFKGDEADIISWDE